MSSHSDCEDDAGSGTSFDPPRDVNEKLKISDSDEDSRCSYEPAWCFPFPIKKKKRGEKRKYLVSHEHLDFIEKNSNSSSSSSNQDGETTEERCSRKRISKKNNMFSKFKRREEMDPSKPRHSYFVVSEDSIPAGMVGNQCCTKEDIEDQANYIKEFAAYSETHKFLPEEIKILQLISRRHFFRKNGMEVKSIMYPTECSVMVGRSNHICFGPCLDIKRETNYLLILEQLKLKTGHSFLNLGSGTGYFSTIAGLIIGSSGVNHGVEINNQMLAYANERQNALKAHSAGLAYFNFCEPQFIEGDCFKLNPGRKYDRIYCCGILPEDQLDLLEDMLKHDGILLAHKDRESVIILQRNGENFERTEVSLPLMLQPMLNLDIIGYVTLPEKNFPTLQDLARGIIRQALRSHLVSLIDEKKQLEDESPAEINWVYLEKWKDQKENDLDKEGSPESNQGNERVSENNLEREVLQENNKEGKDQPEIENDKMYDPKESYAHCSKDYNISQSSGSTSALCFPQGSETISKGCDAVSDDATAENGGTDLLTKETNDKPCLKPSPTPSSSSEQYFSFQHIVQHSSLQECKDIVVNYKLEDLHLPETDNFHHDVGNTSSDGDYVTEQGFRRSGRRFDDYPSDQGEEYQDYLYEDSSVSDYHYFSDGSVNSLSCPRCGLPNQEINFPLDHLSFLNKPIFRGSIINAELFQLNVAKLPLPKALKLFVLHKNNLEGYEIYSSLN